MIAGDCCTVRKKRCIANEFEIIHTIRHLLFKVAQMLISPRAVRVSRVKVVKGRRRQRRSAVAEVGGAVTALDLAETSRDAVVGRGNPRPKRSMWTMVCPPNRSCESCPRLPSRPANLIVTPISSKLLEGR